MSKALRKAIMHKSKFKNMYNEKKDRCKLGKFKKNNGIFVLRYFMELRKNIFFLKEDQGGPPVTLNDILKKSTYHPSIDKIRKTHERNKKFPVQKVTQNT